MGEKPGFSVCKGSLAIRVVDLQTDSQVHLEKTRFRSRPIQHRRQIHKNIRCHPL